MTAGLALLFSIGAAQAQTTSVLVSNTGQTTSNTGGTSLDHAQGFTTGSHALGYKLTSVDIDLGLGASGSGLPPYTVELWSDSSTTAGEPGSRTHTLTNPDTLVTGINNFTATGSGIDLAADTTYHVLLNNNVVGGTRNISIRNTASTADDAGAATGWSIADASHFRGHADTENAWSDWASVRKIAIRGFAKDATAPVLSTATVEGTTLTLTYDEALDTASTPAAADFTVTVAGSAATVSMVDVTGSTVVLTLATAVTSGQAVTLSYTVPTGMMANPIQDVAGNDAVALTGQTVTVVDTPPMLVSAAMQADLSILLTYDEALDTNSKPAATAFAVTVDTAPAVNPATVAIAGSKVTLTLVTVATPDQTVVVSYTAPDMNPLQDPSGNKAASFSDQPVAPPDTTPPMITSATVEGTTLILTYDEALDESSVPARASFTVDVDGTTPGTSTPVISGTTVTMTLTLTTAVTASQMVTLDYTVPSDNPIQDLVGNDAVALTGQTVDVVDTTAPTFNSATAEGTTLTLTYNEALDTGSTPAAGDFTVMVGGTEVNLAATDPVDVTGDTVVLTLAAAVALSDTVTVSYAVPTTNPIRDTAGNDAIALTGEMVTVVDTTPPMLTGAEVSGMTLTLTYDETLDAASMPAAGDFSVVVDGTRVFPSAATVTGATVMLTLAAAASSSQTFTVNYTKGANPIQDATGNEADALANQAVTVMDTTAPTFSSATAEGTTLTLTYDEALDPASTPAAGDFTVTVGGTAVTLAATEPVDVTDSTVVLTLAAAVALADTVTVSYTVPGTSPIQDAAGNGAGALTGQMVTVVDTTPPTLIDATVEGMTLILTYDEALNESTVPARASFVVDVDGTTPGTSTPSISGATVTMTLTSAVTASQTVTLDYTVPDTNPLQDPTGNEAAALTGHAVDVVDTTPPMLTAATAEGTTLTLTYNEALDTTSTPAAGDFTVSVGGTGVNLAATNPVDVTGSTVVLTLAAAVALSDTVTVSYTVPGTNPIQDTAGNDAIALTNEMVTVVDTTPPMLTGAEVSGMTLTLTYDETLDATLMPAAGDFSVVVDGTRVFPSAATVTGVTVMLTLAAAASSSQTFTVNYTKGANPIRDATGNEAAALSDQAVTVTDTTAPTFSSAAAEGTTLTLTYDEALDTASAPAAGAFTVMVAGSSAVVSGVDVMGATVVLTLASAVALGDTVTVSYTVPGTNPIQDAVGNDAGALTGQMFTVVDATPPMLIDATVAGMTLTLTYDEALDDTSVPARASFVVRADETTPGTSTPSISGATVTMTLTTAVTASQTVTLDYTVPDTNPLQDLSGNEAAALTGHTVTVLDSTAPTFSSATAEGTTLTLTYNEALDTGSTPAAEAFTVMAAGSSASVSGVRVEGSTVVLTLAAAVALGDTVTVSYAVPTTNPIQDAAGNDAGALTGQAATVVDTMPPTLTGASVDGSTLTLTYDEALDATSMPAAGDFSVMVGATTVIPTNAAISGATVVLTLPSPVASGQTVTVNYTKGANPIQDATGNDAVALSNQDVTRPDTTAPSLSTATVSGMTLTLTYDETLDATSTPAVGDFTVTVAGTTGTNPTAVDVTDSTVTLTLASAVTSGQTVTVTYTAPTTGAIQDAVGNKAASLTGRAVTVLSSDATLSGLALTDASDMSLTLDQTFAAATATYTISVGNAVSSVKVTATVNESNATLTGSLAKASGTPETVTMTSGMAATLSGLTVGANVLTITVTAEDSTEREYTLTVTRAAAVVDTTAPVLSTVTVSGTTLTLTYDEALGANSMPAVGDFMVSVAGGTATNPSAVSVTGATVVLTLASAVPSGQTVAVTYTVPTGATANPIQDAAGNAAAAFAGRTATAPDTVAPTLSSATAEGTTLTLAYDEALDATSVPAAGDFTVTVAGSSATVSGVNVIGSTVVLTLGSAVTVGQTVAVTYTVPTGAMANPIQDAAGNDAGALSGESVTVVDTTAPILSSAAVSGTTLTLTYDEALGANSMPTVGDFTVTVGGSSATVSGVNVTGATVVLTLASAVAFVQPVTVSYAVPATNPLQDADGNAAAALTAETVTVMDTVAPTLDSATAEGTMLTLTYSEALDANSVPTVTAFDVTVGTAVAVNPSAVAVAGSEVTLTLAAAVMPGQSVMVSYTVPTGAAANPIQDAAGNGAGALIGETVTVVDTTAPVLSSAAVSGTTLILTYDEALDANSAPAATAFTVMVAGSSATVSGVNVTGSTVVLTLASAVAFVQTVTVSYAVPATNPIQDAAGNAAAALTAEMVAVMDTVAPTLDSATAEGTTLTLTYSEPLDTNSMPAAMAFDVTVGTAATVNPSTVTVIDSTVILTLAAAVMPGQTVTVSYTVPATNPIQDTAGNVAAALTDEPVTVASQARERIERVTKMTQPEFLRMAMNFAVEAIADRLAPGGRESTGSPLGLMGRLLEASGVANTGYLPQVGLPAQPSLPGGSSGQQAAAPSANNLPAILSAVSGGHAASESAGLSRSLGDASVWVSGGYRKQSGGDGGDLRWNGDAYHVHVGIDKPFGEDLIGGLSVGYFSGDFDYTERSGDTAVGGSIETEITSVQPYLGWRPSERLNLWGMVGYGEGEIDVKDEDAETQSSDADQRMVALGGRYRLRGDSSTMQLDLKAEVSAGRLDIDGNDRDIEASDISSSRWRLAVEGTREMALEDGRRLLPSLGLGARLDRGDGVTGTGVELTAGLDYHDTPRGLLMQADVRWLPAYDNRGRGDRLKEWAASGAIRLLPQASGRGLSFELSQSWGDVASGVERLWNDGAGQGWGDAAASGPRLETRLGYGMNGMGGLLTPYFGATHEDGRGSLLLGADWERGRTSFSLRAERRTGGRQEPDHFLGLELTSSW